jgi:2-keto-4-pentenoate hydratase/2-oxohepta-3-ene-1,7-dioic acid hydratase in catechol pathway
MKLAKIESSGRNADAIIEGDSVRLIGNWREGPAAASPFTLPKLLVEHSGRLPAASGECLPADSVRFAPPADFSTKIICLGMNYKNHVAEVLADIAPNPPLFFRWLDTLVGGNEKMICPSCSSTFDYEGEIVAVIGKGGRYISTENALEHVLGYTCLNDGSVREYQKHSPSAGKNFWRSGALGPWIVTADEIADYRQMALQTRLNGSVVQSSTADLMIYDLPTAIAYISRFTPLAAGDLISTGTPGGVGSRRTPPLWMKSGDIVEVEVSGIGVLRNKISVEPNEQHG